MTKRLHASEIKIPPNLCFDSFSFDFPYLFFLLCLVAALTVTAFCLLPGLTLTFDIVFCIARLITPEFVHKHSNIDRLSYMTVRCCTQGCQQLSDDHRITHIDRITNVNLSMTFNFHGQILAIVTRLICRVAHHQAIVSSFEG